MLHFRRSRDRGAVLVEMALVTPVLLLMLMGIVDMGVRLSNLHALEDGIRDAARSAAVDQVGDDSSCTVVAATPPDATTRKLICLAKARVGLDEADTRVKIAFDTGGPVTPEPILVCVEYPAESITGFMPTLGGGEIVARSVMRLEVDSSVSAFAETSLAGTWSECVI